MSLELYYIYLKVIKQEMYIAADHYKNAFTISIGPDPKYVRRCYKLVLEPVQGESVT